MIADRVNKQNIMVILDFTTAAVILAFSFLMDFIMALSTIFTVQMMSVIQRETPRHLIGKVISVILTVAMCAQPLGSALYGVLFEVCVGAEFAVIFFSGAVSLVIAVRSGKIFAGLGE